MMINKKNSVTAILLFLFALWIRLYFIQETIIINPVKSDAANYAIYAGNIVNHQIFSKEQSKNPTPDSFSAPGYPAFLATNTLWTRFFEVYDYSVILVSQALLSAGIVTLTFLLGGMLFRHGWALSASLLTMFSPHLIAYTGVLLTEILFSFLLLSAIYSFFLFTLKKSSGAGIFSGLLFGMAYLTNPVLLLLPLLVATITVYVKRSLSLKKILPWLTIFLIIVSSWTIRNTINVEANSPSSSDRLYTSLVVGLHADYLETWEKNPRDPNNPATQDLISFAGSYKALAEAMINRITSKPEHYLKWYLFDKPISLWQWDVGIGFSDVFIYPVEISPYYVYKPAIASHSIMQYMHEWLLLFALLGIAVGLFHWKTTGVATLITITTVVYMSAVYVATQADARYSVPLRPEMYLLAMFFFERVYAGVVHLRHKTNSI